MLDIHVARDRVVLRAIETGEMPNFDLIHTMQRAEGYEPCFGRAQGFCHETGCRWHSECMALAAFQGTARSAVSAATLRPLRQLLPTGAGTYRDGTTSPGGHVKPPGDPIRKKSRELQSAQPL